MEEKLTLEIVEERIKKLSSKHELPLRHPKVLWYYGKEYGGLPKDIADVIFPLTDLITIRKFAQIAGIKIDERKFRNRREFQMYFRELMKE